MNLFKKLFTASLLIVALVMSVAVMGKVKVKAAEESLVFSEQGYSNQQEITTAISTNFTVSFNKGTNSNAPKYFTTGNAVRIYGGGYFVVSSENTLTKIVLKFSSGEGTNAITTDVGTYASDTWTGSSVSVKFTVGGTSGHRRLASIDVTYSLPNRSISFDKNGGIGNDPSPIEVSNGGTSLALPNNPYTKEYYTFKEWNTQADGNGTSYQPGDTISNVTDDIILYAIWELDSENYVMINFESNGGTPVNQQIKDKGSKVDKPLDPTRDNYTFDGWYKEKELENLWDFESDTVSQNITLYAKWETNLSARDFFELLNTKAKIKVSYSTSPLFELFSGEIEEGDYVIYYGGKMMNTTVSNNRLQYEEVTPENGIITDQVPSSCIWHIAPAAENGYWTLYNAVENKYAASTETKNQAQMLDDGSDDKALWAISGTSTYEFVNKANDDAGINKNLRNNDDYGFACYSTQIGGALTLYKLGESITIKQEESKNDLSLQFAGLIDKELKDQLDASGSNVTYGMFYCKTSNISTTLVDDLSSSLNDPSPLSLSELEELGYYSTSIASNSVVGTDASGMNEVLNNPSYYIYAVSINHIDDANINTSISAVAYVCIDGVYSFMAEKQCSVKSLAAEYLSLPDKSSFNGHLGVLAYLAN